MTRLRALPGRFGRCTSGATAVEFALVIFPFLLTIFGLIEFARAYQTQTSLEWVADRINREFIIEESCATFTNTLEVKLEDHKEEFRAGHSELLEINERTDTEGGRAFDLSYPINLFLPFTDITTLDLTVTRVTVCEAFPE